MKKTALAIFLMATLMLTACGGSSPGTQEVYEAHSAAMDNGDLEEALKYIDDDAVFTVPIGIVEGKEEIKGFLQESLDGGSAATTENCVVDGSLLNCDFSIDFGPIKVRGDLEVTVKKGLITAYTFTVAQ